MRFFVITPQDIISKIKEYEINVDEPLIKNAYVFALDYHGTQLRESGDPYFSHPLEVAEILISLKMDQNTIVAGLLHDTVEDTPATIEIIKEKFGDDIASIVDGVTKLSKLSKFEGSTLAQKQTENFKKLLMSAASDIRVLIIKLVDRLHNMRTLKYKKKKIRRQQIARETMEIYAPLAERIGMSNIKDELQDISFKELYPEIHDSIKEKLSYLYESSEKIIETISSELRELTNEMGIDCTVNGRLKTPYSIWQKMNIRSISFEQLSDIMAFRIIVDTVNQCYQVLGGIHRKYLVVPGRFRDYISTPKNNSYQSLHTSVIGPLNKRIEVQIRTKDMHKVAEYGIAAHWNYKEGGYSNENKNNCKWLKNLVQILENTSGMDEFLESSKIEMFTDCVYCITPMGQIISLPKGASALDFAYAIHSDIGNHAIGAKINGKSVPIRTIIDNGDQIEILTDKKHGPAPHWESYVVTIKAKTAIRKAINSIEKEKIEMIGKTNIYEFFEGNNLEITDEDLEKIYRSFGLDNLQTFFHSIGIGSITLREIISAYNEIKQRKGDLISPDIGNIKQQKNSELLIVGLPNVPILPVTCCYPVPGDKIVGLLFPDKGIEIHINQCQVMLDQEANSNAKFIELAWTKSAFDGENKYIAKLLINMTCDAGNLSKIAYVIEKKKAGVVNLKLGEKFENFVRAQIEIEVTDSYQVTMIIAEIRSFDFVTEISRI